MYLFALCIFLTNSIVDSFSPLRVSFQPARHYLHSLSERKGGEWNDEHLVHDATEIHEETEEEMRESEEAAAFDAHDLNDPGMEAAMMERSVIIANEMAHNYKEKEKHPVDEINKKNWNNEHLVHDATEIHEETEDELLESEEAAAFDAHDLNDPGMEAAMMVRAVIFANEMAHKYKKKAEHNKDD